ncbi:rhodanese-like domain-containing protein [Phenylobacterium sp. LjRoot225]|uniref:rhodanese-like domain-containing protein n=1 Tax=Phenylobacterium sp. LjRoot225 TaxID=3342285 RepID=UPI003ED11400
MCARLTPLTPKEVADRLAAGRAVLVDIREPDEFARRHVKGARPLPLSRFEATHLKVDPAKHVVFTCRSGMRTESNGERLAACVEGETFMLAGGVDAWAAAGLPVETDAKAPLELMRQVQIAAGALVLLGVALGLLVHPGFLGLSASVGAGLTLAGVTGFCGMARLLALAPWNQRRAA